MATPYQQLVQDHRNLIRVLRFLRDEIGHYDDMMRETSVSQVLEALDYISNYPQAFHHPLEEAAFAFMEEHGIGDTAVMEKIRRQHEELERETAELLQLFNMIYEDHVVPADRIREALNRYLDLQFEHIETEDNEIFPTFENELTAQDWKTIARKVDQKDDPLFHTPHVESYSELSRSLGLR